MSQEISPGIVVDPAIRHGKPVIQGTRVPVDLVIAQLAGGMSFDEVMEEYDLTIEAIRAALQYAADVLAADELRAIA